MSKKDDKKDVKTAPKKEEAKKDAPKKEEAKKTEAPKKEEVKKADPVAKDAKPKVAKTETKTEGAATGNIMDDLTKKQAFKKFSYRGEDIGKLVGLNMDELS